MADLEPALPGEVIYLLRDYYVYGPVVSALGEQGRATFVFYCVISCPFECFAHSMSVHPIRIWVMSFRVHRLKMGASWDHDPVPQRNETSLCHVPGYCT